MATAAQRFESDRSKFPGMQIDEILVWKAWLAVHQGSYDRFDYNVRLGPEPDLPATLVEPYRSGSIALGMPRLDAVGWQGGIPTIFEVERIAQPRAVGQLITYRHLWEASNLSAASPQLALVAHSYRSSIMPALEANGIDLYTFPVDFSQLAPARAR
jgi:hypothetical protein